MPLPASDPRVLFAAERTLLAWVRTSIAVMGIGFLIARFGLFLYLGSLQVATVRPGLQIGVSSALGMLFVLLGAAVAGIAALQHRRFIAELPPQDVPASHAAWWPVAFGLSIGLLGLVLSVYLFISQPL